MWLKKVLPYIVIAVLLGLLFQKQPAKPYVIERGIKDLEPIVLTDTIVIKGKPQIVEKENPVNEKLLNDFKELQDSLKQIEMYKDAITQRTYKEVYNTPEADIKVESKVQGYLTNQKISFTPRAKKKFDVFAGVETTITTKPTYTGNIYIQRKRTIYKIGYNSDKQISVGVAFKLF